MEPCELGESSRTILEAIAEGRSYDQILLLGVADTYHDIFRAAAEALDIAERVKIGKTYDQRMAEIRQTNPRAYEKWSSEEDAKLTSLFRAGASIGELANTHERQPSAIRSRLAKLDLTSES